MSGYRPLLAGLALTLLAGSAVAAVGRVQAYAAHDYLAIDYRTFVVFGQRWLDTGSMYLAYQLAGPFEPRPAHVPAVMPSMYPPLAAPVFAALTVLPAVVWWAVPLVAIGWSLRRAPAWTWPLLGLAACWPDTLTIVLVGSTTLWAAAGIALAGRYGWPVIVVLLKPTLLPFAATGLRHWRPALTGAVVLAALSLFLLPEWIRYVSVVQNADSGGLLYSLRDWPPLLALALATYERQVDDRLRREGVVQPAKALGIGELARHEGSSADLPELPQRL